MKTITVEHLKNILGDIDQEFFDGYVTTDSSGWTEVHSKLPVFQPSKSENKYFPTSLVKEEDYGFWQNTLNSSKDHKFLADHPSQELTNLYDSTKPCEWILKVNIMESIEQDSQIEEEA